MVDEGHICQFVLGALDKTPASELAPTRKRVRDFDCHKLQGAPLSVRPAVGGKTAREKREKDRERGEWKDKAIGKGEEGQGEREEERGEAEKEEERITWRVCI